MDNAPDLQALDPAWTQRLPYHFARRHGVISACLRDGLLEIWAKPGVSSATLAELDRALGQPIQVRELSAAMFDSALNRAYERGVSQAMDIVDDLDDDLDMAELTQKPAAGHGPDGKRGRCDDRAAHQRPADPGGARGCLRHPHRTVREP